MIQRQRFRLWLRRRVLNVDTGSAAYCCIQLASGGQWILPLTITEHFEDESRMSALVEESEIALIQYLALSSSCYSPHDGENGPNSYFIFNADQ